MLTGTVRFRSRNGAILAACIAVGMLALGLSILKAYDRIYRPGIITVDPQATPFWGPVESRSDAVV